MRGGCMPGDTPAWYSLKHAARQHPKRQKNTRQSALRVVTCVDAWHCCARRHGSRLALLMTRCLPATHQQVHRPVRRRRNQVCAIPAERHRRQPPRLHVVQRGLPRRRVGRGAAVHAWGGQGTERGGKGHGAGSGFCRAGHAGSCSFRALATCCGPRVRPPDTTLATPAPLYPQHHDPGTCARRSCPRRLPASGCTRTTPSAEPSSATSPCLPYAKYDTGAEGKPSSRGEATGSSRCTRHT